MADSIGKQVVDELAGIGKKAVTDFVDAGWERGVLGTTGKAAAGQQKSADDNLAQMKQQKETVANQRFQAVKRELEAYQARMKTVKKQEEQVKEQQKMRDLEVKKSQKAQQDEDFIHRVQMAYSGTGEGSAGKVGG